MSQKERQVRVWADGCFDIVHFGHANMFRQARELGDYVVASVHLDVDFVAGKGKPVFDETERFKLIKSIKWVDQVVEAPNIHSLETLDFYRCDFAVHGEDKPVRADGKDPHGFLQAAGRYKEIKRTKCISTTDIIEKLLKATQVEQVTNEGDDINKDHSQSTTDDLTDMSNFFYTSHLIYLFSDRRKALPHEKVVYVKGDFDVFHVGHLDFLEKAASQGDYLIVGLHTDDMIRKQKGASYPIMALHERALSVLACKYVNQVIIGTSYSVRSEQIDNFKMDIVCHGMTPVFPDLDGSDPYAEARQRGIFKTIDSGNTLTTDIVVQRFAKRRSEFERRNLKKREREKLELEEIDVQADVKGK